ncbi:MAG: response regulator, partial [Planctomycetes bacterium]|nr:response regulator [Planctomycetota bacterium]
MIKLLVVDDKEQNLYMLQVLLQGHGYDVALASNGAEALEKARRNPPDLIIADILMPVMDGFTLCREWKKDEHLKTIPFVFYTATYTDPKDEEFALNLGAERFIIKPTEPEKFIKILQEVIDQCKAGQLKPSCEPIEEEVVYLKQYNETLI